MATGRIPINGTAAIQSTIVDAKGDLIVATGADAVDRLAVGTDGFTLVADSVETTGLKWVAPAAGGKVLQVVQASITTPTSITTLTPTSTSLTATITPSSTSSKILVFVSQNFALSRAATTNNEIGFGWDIRRASTTIVTIAAPQPFYLYSSTTSNPLQSQGILNYNYLDSPATTSATTYTTRANSYPTGSETVTFQGNSDPSTIILMEIGA